MRFTVLSVLVVGTTAFAETDNRAYLDVTAGPHVTAAAGEVHGGGGIAIRGHDLSRVLPIDVEVGFDRTAWNDDFGDGRFHRVRALLTSWMQWDTPNSTTTLSLGGGIEMRFLRRDIMSTNNTLHDHASSPQLVVSALHARRVGSTWVGLEALARGTTYGVACGLSSSSCSDEFYKYGNSLDVELRLVVRL